jgi:hypothetical protein
MGIAALIVDRREAIPAHLKYIRVKSIWITKRDGLERKSKHVTIYEHSKSV